MLGSIKQKKRRKDYSTLQHSKIIKYNAVYPKYNKNSLNSVNPSKSIEFLAVNTKLPEMAILVSKDLRATKKLPAVVINGSRYYH